MVECSEGEVLAWLVKAVSQAPDEAKAGAEQLALYGTRLEYFRFLAQLYPLPDVPYDARLLCLIQLKQFVQSRWVCGRAPDDSFPLGNEQRAWFRQHFLANFRLPQSQLQQQLAAIIARIARSDWPNDWPELLPSLMLELERAGQDDVDEAGAAPLVVLGQVVKAFASRRLPSYRQLFYAFASQVMPLLLRASTDAMNSLRAGLESSADCRRLLLLLERIRGFLGIVRSLVEFGFRDSSPCAEFDEVVVLTLDFCRYLLEAEASLPGALLPAGERALAKATRLLLVCQEQQPRAFARHIPAAVHGLILPHTALAPSPRSALRSDAALRNLLNLLHVLLTCPRYRPRICRREADKAAAVVTREGLRAALEPHLGALLRHLVLGHLVLDAEDEAALAADGEGLVFPEEAEQEWRFGLRGCVQCLLLLLCTEFDAAAPALVLGLVRECLEAGGDGPAAGRRREAALGVLGAVLAWVQAEVDAEEVCARLVLPLLLAAPPAGGSEEGNHRLALQRRALWLLGEVIDDSLAPATVEALLRAVWAFLGPEHHVVLRLQAARSLSKAVGALDDSPLFDAALLPGLPVAFAALLDLVGGGVRETSTRLKLVQVLRLCVAGLQYSPARLAALRALLPGLPAFWDAAPADQPMLRHALLGLYADAVAALGAEAVLLHDLVCALVAVAVPEDADGDDCLLDGGLALWHAFLTHARLLEQPSEAKQGLVQLFPRALPHLERGGDVALVCLGVAEAYVVVAGMPFMRAFAGPLAQALFDLVRAAEPGLADAALLAAETVVRVYPAEAPALFAPLLDHLIALFAAHVGPMEEVAELRANHVRLAARLFLADPQAVRAAAQGREEALGCFVTRVRYHMVQWSSPRVRRLMALALAAQVAAFGPAVAGVGAQFEEIVDGLLAAVAELQPEQQQQTGAGAPGTCADAASSSENACALPQARRVVFRDDPLYTCDLRRWVGECFGKLRLLAGEAAFEEQLGALDPVVRQQLLGLMA